MRKITDHGVDGKCVLVRVDFNCPIENARIASDVRIRAHAQTIKNLSDRGAKVVVLSHQGRKGRKDFMDLSQHAQRLQELIDREVYFVADVVGENALKAIRKLRSGSILVLDNVRKLHCETQHPDGNGEIAYHLSPVADYFVLDALSVAHRKHSSIVGFCNKIPCFAGEVLAAELDAVDNVKSGNNVTFVFGGSKANDSFAVMDKWLSEGKAKKMLIGGALSVLLLYASGHNVGNSIDYLESSGLMEKVPAAKRMLEKFDGKIALPSDVMLRLQSEESKFASSLSQSDRITKGEIWDIGTNTVREYVEIIKNSDYVVMNGPVGVYEVEEFSKGTRAILEAIADCNAFSLLGGGHTLAAIERFNLEKNKFGYVSLSGKALLRYLCGKELIGIKALEENEKRFKEL